MKKIIFAACVALSIISCSSDDNSNEDISGSNDDISGTKTTKVEASFGNSFLQPNTTANNVERGTIPVAIEKITVVATNISTPDFPASTTVFDLVANGTAGADQKFYIDDIASGTNSFTADATTNGEKITSEKIYDDALAKNAFDANKNTTPFAQYTATTSAQIVFTSPKTITFNMSTSNGKLNTYIYTGTTITATNRKVTVKRQTFAADGTPINNSPLIYNITGSKSFVSTWSDAVAVKDNYAVLDITVYDANGITPEYTKQQRITIKASTTTNTTIAITKDGITTSENEATFNFPIWVVEGE